MIHESVRAMIRGVGANGGRHTDPHGAPTDDDAGECEWSFAASAAKSESEPATWPRVVAESKRHHFPELSERDARADKGKRLVGLVEKRRSMDQGV